MSQQEVQEGQGLDPEVQKFQQVMRSYMKVHERTYGIKQNLRHLQPPMKDMLSIRHHKNDRWNFYTDNMNLAQSNQYQTVKNRIFKSRSPYESEYHDLYKPYQQDPVMGASYQVNVKDVDLNLKQMNANEKYFQQLKEKLQQQICRGEFYQDQFPKRFLTRYTEDYGKQRIESYEDLLKKLAQTKEGRNLLQQLVGQTLVGKDGQEMIIGPKFQIVRKKYDQWVTELLNVASYADIQEGLLNTPQGQQFLVEFMQLHLTANKGEVDFDKVLSTLKRLYPTKEELVGILKNSSQRNKLILNLTQYIKELYKVEEQELQGGENGSEQECLSDLGATDYSKVESRLFKKKRKPQKLSPKKHKERVKRRLKRIQKFKEQSRWLANTAFQTYFGKPAFALYGQGNTHPTAGGCVYGQYMLSHNVNPHRAGNNPPQKEVFEGAENKYGTLNLRKCEPPRKCKDEFMHSQKQVKMMKERNQLTKKRKKSPSKKFQVSDLVNTQRFASPLDSVASENGDNKPRLSAAEKLDMLKRRSSKIRTKNAEDLEAEDKQFFKKNISKNIEAQLAQDKKDQKLLKKRAGKKKPAKKGKKTVIKVLKANLSKKQLRKLKKVLKQFCELRNLNLKNLFSRYLNDDQKEKLMAQLEENANKPNQLADYLTEGLQKGKEVTEYTDAYRNDDFVDQELANPRRKVVQLPTMTWVQDTFSSQQGRQTQQQPQTDVYHTVQCPQPCLRPHTVSQTIRKTPSVAKQEDEYFDNYTDVEKLRATLFQDANRNREQTLRQVYNQQDPRSKTQQYFQSLSRLELDPKNYKQIPAVWTNRIPMAGLVSKPHANIKENFDFGF